MIRYPSILRVLTVFTVFLPLSVEAEPFQSIRIGDADGFGFARTSTLARPVLGVGPGPADTNANGILEPEEFLPDLNRVFGIIFMVNTGYIMPLFTDPRGTTLIGFGLFSQFVGIAIMAKMVRFEI